MRPALSTMVPRSMLADVIGWMRALMMATRSGGFFGFVWIFRFLGFSSVWSGRWSR